MSFFVAIAVGFLLSTLLPTQGMRSLPGYDLVLYALLAVGLYGSVSDNDILPAPSGGD